ncbi:uncharacterized protein LOC107365314 [Tetranychus urticae]|uniref:Uncharacterized protein n=1 Tax=Tetranychus urticae TaxID=32264 RepID=T1KLG9_TETUR|nr:uncharacterized protein LOC107365314 [Tetranychus urticae]
MPSASKRVNGYGLMGLLIAVFGGVCFYLVKSKEGCLGLEDYDKVQAFHIVGLITGLVLFILGVLNFAGVIHDIVVLFYIAVLGILVAGGIMVYTSVLIFNMPCNLSVDGAFKSLKSLVDNKRHNIFLAEDGNMIAVFILDILSALMLFSASGSFYRG